MHARAMHVDWLTSSGSLHMTFGHIRWFLCQLESVPSPAVLSKSKEMDGSYVEISDQGTQLRQAEATHTNSNEQKSQVPGTPSIRFPTYH